MVGVLLLLAGACGGSESAPPDTLAAKGPPPPPGGPTGIWTVQVGVLPESAQAARLVDSLERAGWTATVRKVVGEDTFPPWRVRVAAAARESRVPARVAAAFAAAGRPGGVVADVATLSRWVTVHQVSNGVMPGTMLSRARWALSPDRRGMIVMDDAVAVENGAMPNGFLAVVEGQGARPPFRLQRDGVWDVAPSPDWSRVAYGRAFVMSGRGADSLFSRDAAIIASQTGLAIDQVQRGRFSISTMDAVYGFAAPAIEPLADTGGTDSPMYKEARSGVPVAGGWRVRWSADGRTLAVATAPTGVTDNAPARAWLAVDVYNGLVRGRLAPETRLATVPWTDGPLIDVSAPLDSSARTLALDGGVVTSGGGWIRMRGGASEWTEPRIVGPGTALAVTRTGRFIAALVPRPGAKETDAKTELVVYEIRP
jgi:hypothetical protein